MSKERHNVIVYCFRSNVISPLMTVLRLAPSRYSDVATCNYNNYIILKLLNTSVT